MAKKKAEVTTATADPAATGTADLFDDLSARRAAATQAYVELAEQIARDEHVAPDDAQRVLAAADKTIEQLKERARRLRRVHALDQMIKQNNIGSALSELNAARGKEIDDELRQQNDLEKQRLDNDIRYHAELNRLTQTSNRRHNAEKERKRLFAELLTELEPPPPKVEQPAVAEGVGPSIGGVI